jgi:predicted transcriptional regulator
VTIRQITIHLDPEVATALASLVAISGGSPESHAHRALIQYLDGAGHRAMVTGLAERARSELRGVLEELSRASR